MEKFELTLPEQKLLDAAKAGELLVLENLAPLELKKGNSAAPLRAAVIRDIALGRHGEVDPRGIRLKGAWIYGELDLDALHTSTWLSLIQCAFERPVFARGAHLSRLDLSGSHMPGLYADGLNVNGDLLLTDRCTILGDHKIGAVQLMGARIAGDFSCRSSVIVNDIGPAMSAARLRVEGGLFLTGGFRAEANSESGAIRLLGAQVSGPIDATEAQILNTSGPAVHADRIRVDGSLFLR